MAATVLIAPQEHLDALKGREELAGATAFPDTDALKALDTITRQKPTLVALERMFAATSRGAALINRIKADPSLTGCEIRIVAHDSEYARVSPRPAAAAAPSAPPVAVAEPDAPAVAPLDQRGTRRAPRFKIVDGVEVMIDGNPAKLVDLSLVGAMVVSATSLKPNQRLRFAIGDGAKPMRFSAAVAWAFFELPPRYRAGIEFFDADVDGLAKFIEARKKT